MASAQGALVFDEVEESIERFADSLKRMLRTGGAAMFELYDFRFSHYSEKARWALDFKGIPYTSHHLLPGFHMRTTRQLAPRTCVPILKAKGVIVQDSTEIINFLDHICPERSLTPADHAVEAMEWEEYLDKEVGATLRLWFYYHTLPDRARAVKFLCEGASWFERAQFAFAFAHIRRAMTQMMDIHAGPASEAVRRLLTALDRLDRTLEGRPFLVGDRFSRADLTACSLLGPLCRPGESPSQVNAILPSPVSALREQLKQRRFYSWVLKQYRENRAPVYR